MGGEREREKEREWGEERKREREGKNTFVKMGKQRQLQSVNPDLEP